MILVCLFYGNYTYQFIYIYIYIYIYTYTYTNIYLYIFFEAVILIMCDFFPKSLKTHFFILQIFRNHFGSFFCASIYVMYKCQNICIKNQDKTKTFIYSKGILRILPNLQRLNKITESVKSINLKTN